MRTYNVFISHSWSYGKDYNDLVDILHKASFFDFKNYSVPKDDPIHSADNTTELENAIEAKIKPCSVIIIMAGKYSTYSKWINREIDIANRLEKPIVAIRPWASLQASQIVKDNADEIVGWNGPSITKAIKNNSI